MPVSFTTIEYETAPPVTTIRLNRPERLNAINRGMMAELHAALDRAQADDACRALILEGTGRAFSAGFDLKETTAQPVHGVVEWRRRLLEDVDLSLRVWDFAKPTIAAVHGHCLAGAIELAVMCDFTIAAAGTVLAEPEVRFGSGIVTMILPWLIGVKRSKDLLLRGHAHLTAEEAVGIGLINQVVPGERLRAAADALARELATLDPFVLRMTKVSINRTLDVMGLRSALAYALEVSTLIEAAETPDRQEFNRIRDAEGLRAAITWRDSRFRQTPGCSTPTPHIP